jgi:hypothetical protein
MDIRGGAIKGLQQEALLGLLGGRLRNLVDDLQEARHAVGVEPGPADLKHDLWVELIPADWHDGGHTSFSPGDMPGIGTP